LGIRHPEEEVSLVSQPDSLRHKLHIGCGAHLLAARGWLDTDIEPSDGVVKMDATQPFPLNDCSFTHVYSEHMLEHIQFDAGRRMLSECYRVLVRGGRIRIATPDLAFLFGVWKEPDRFRDYLDFKRETSCALVNNFMREGGLHQFIYDDITLAVSMADAGFADIKRLPVLESNDPELRGLEFVERMPAGFLALETMVLEGLKLDT
jgi:predicted SAM-dependent methyltransferase